MYLKHCTYEQLTNVLLAGSLLLLVLTRSIIFFCIIAQDFIVNSAFEHFYAILRFINANFINSTSIKYFVINSVTLS